MVKVAANFRSGVWLFIFLLAACNSVSNGPSEAEAVKQMTAYMQNFKALSHVLEFIQLTVTDTRKVDASTIDVIYQAVYTAKIDWGPDAQLSEIAGGPFLRGARGPKKKGDQFTVAGIQGRFVKYDRGGWRLQP